MSDEKTAKFTISMPAEIAEAMDAHIGTMPKQTRSGWLSDLATRELTAAGALTGSSLRAELLTYANQVGLETALAAVKRAARAKKAA